ncbi:hypothetical protein [Endozoicomonas atrinae]|uniref:hypothetical protein n=1 Tax=Endozoicomonas atrinae TaxID=1333660 RepID=UPI0008257122|nr:hypothetical protein [Endozoicomonas atrinae]
MNVESTPSVLVNYNNNTQLPVDYSKLQVESFVLFAQMKCSRCPEPSFYEQMIQSTCCDSFVCGNCYKDALFNGKIKVCDCDQSVKIKGGFGDYIFGDYIKVRNLRENLWNLIRVDCPVPECRESIGLDKAEQHLKMVHQGGHREISDHDQEKLKTHCRVVRALENDQVERSHVESAFTGSLNEFIRRTDWHSPDYMMKLNGVRYSKTEVFFHSLNYVGYEELGGSNMFDNIFNAQDKVMDLYKGQPVEFLVRDVFYAYIKIGHNDCAERFKSMCGVTEMLPPAEEKQVSKEQTSKEQTSSSFVPKYIADWGNYLKQSFDWLMR